MPELGTVDRNRWIAHLEVLTRDVLNAVPFGANESARVGYIDEFRDEFGNRRGSDRAFLSSVLGVSLGATREPAEMGLDERLWWCVVNGEPVPEGLLAARDGLVADPDALAIE